MIRSIVTVLLLCVASVFSANYITLNGEISQPKITILNSDLTQIRVKIDFPGFYMQDTVREGITFQQVTMPKTGVTIDEGLPQVPQTVQLVGIETTGKYEVSLVSADFVNFQNVNIFPAQPQPTRQGQMLPWTMNSEIYETNAWYPSNPVTKNDEAVLRDYRVLPASIYPVRFNPVKKTIEVAKSIVFDVRKVASFGVNELTPALSESPAFSALYKSFIINYRDLQNSRTPGINGLPDMLIITHDSYYDEVLPFARWKNQKGVFTQIVKTSDISANPTNTQIKNFIQNYYDNATDKPDYLLIVGDVTGSAAVPWFQVGPDMSDMPYYFLAGNDILPDISGGRISVQTPAEANRVFTKLIRYEKNPYLTDPNWFHSALVINSSDFQDPSAGDWAARHFTDYGYDPIHHLGANLGNATVANVYNAVNGGISYVYYIGHGAPTYWVTTGFSITHIPVLTNGEMQPVISSVACNNADLDEPNDVFAEVWLKNNVNNGSVGIMAFTESCAVYETDTLARGMVRAVLSDTITAFGNIIDYGRLHMFQSYGQSCSEPMHQSLLVGEPELQVWTRTPQTLTVNAPAAAFLNIPFVVQVSDPQGPLAGAMVCYWDSLGDMNRGYTDANGEYTVDHGVATPVTGMLTVTGHNKIPYQTPIEVLPPQGPYVMVQNLLPMDSLGNGNGIVESGEQIAFKLTLENIGVDPADSVWVTVSSPDTNISIMQNTSNFGSLSAGASLTAGEFEIEVSPKCPHLYSIPIQMEISASGGNLWNQQRFIQVRGGARIELAQQSINFPNTFLNFTSQQEMTIRNAGPDTLRVTDIVSDIPQFSAQPVEFFVAPGSQRSITISFTPDSTRAFSGMLTVINNDPMNFVTTFSAGGSGIFAPDISTEPDSIPVLALITDSLTKQLRIRNNGLGNLDFSAQVSGYDPHGTLFNDGSGGADNYGHIWIDSDESGGPTFNWVDISTSGNLLPLTGNNAISNPQNIGFSFPYYGTDYGQLRVCTNGWISFSTYSVAYNNFSLPNTLAPRSMIALLWDDLLMNNDSQVFTENQGNRFVIMYNDMYRVTGEGPYNFELILYDNGNIVLQYMSLQNPLHDYTVGIQNQDATDGLTVAYNSAYLHDSLAVLISKHSWLSVEPLAGSVSAQGYLDLLLTVKTNSFPLGDFYASIQIESNDPDEPIIYVPVHLTTSLTGIDGQQEIIPSNLQLAQNYPNPFNPSTTIEYGLPLQQQVEITIFNLLGQKVRTLFNGVQHAGMHKVVWDGINQNGTTVGSGIYVYKLMTPEKSIVRKMIFMK